MLGVAPNLVPQQTNEPVARTTHHEPNGLASMSTASETPSTAVAVTNEPPVVTPSPI
ncbi:MAG: hypothetical protein M5U28_22470 [Sandaracinaceae bacterium]|nr:hypothetical protein [Sandaracinaceae bacterium]